MMAEERRRLGEERLEASRVADRAREAQMKLAAAVRQYVAQGIPIPFALQGSFMCKRVCSCVKGDSCRICTLFMCILLTILVQNHC